MELYTNKWQNQQIKKKFKNRSCGSRAKRASYSRIKQEIPECMIRGWIRGKTSINGKINKYLNRSYMDLRKLQYKSCIDYEYMIYGDGHDDYNEYWLENINDPWLYQQQQIKHKTGIKIQRKKIKPKSSSVPPIIPNKPKTTKLTISKPIPPKNVSKTQSPSKPVTPPKPVKPKKTTFTDIEYKRTEQEEKEYLALNEKYKKLMSEIEGYGIYSSIEGLAERSTYSSHKDDKADITTDNFKKIMKEIRKQLPQNIYTSINGAMFIRFDENNPRFIQALLTGIDDTPYENGLFLFDVYLCDNYPKIPLMIKHITNGSTICHENNGPGGFSPNLHQCSGKVCLSLLGTWSGPSWQSEKSNVYQVLSTIMFMIFGSNHPYYMEPSYGGWEGTVIGRKKHEKCVIEYDEEVMFHNAKYTILETIKTPYLGFEDVIKLHFKLKRKWIIKMIQRWINHDNYSDAFKEKIKPIFEQIKEELNKL